MTALLITIDVELSALLHQRGLGLEDNIRQSIWGQAQGSSYGIGWQMDQLDRQGLKGVFFVDPMPALVHGPEFLKPVVDAIAGRGHEVQLHLHSEWLSHAKISPVEGRTGNNIGDFGLEDQVILLQMARQWLEEAGAPPVSAFRAGNFGADDNTLRALARLGIRWDSSLNAAYLGRGCRIGVDPGQIGVTKRCGVTELPISGIADRPGSFRPAQICAMSTSEMRVGLRHALHNSHDSFVVVTHSFEMLSRDRHRPNHAVMRRFTALCRDAAAMSGLKVAGFQDLNPDLSAAPLRPLTRATPNRMRTTARMAQQLWATWRYERRLVPA